MIDPSLALQTALRTRLTGFVALIAIVPPGNILDHSGPAVRFPSVSIGEGQTVHEELTYQRDCVRTYLDIHLWDQADDLGGVKAIAGTIRDALRGFAPCSIDDHRVVDLVIATSRFMRDRESATPLAHAVVTINALLQETVSA